MEESFKYGSCKLFPTPVWVSLPSDPEAALLITPRTYESIASTQELAYLISQNKDFYKYETYRSLLTEVTTDTKNILGFPDIESVINQLDNSDILFLFERLMELSVVSKTQLENISDMLDIQLNSQFREDSWDCTICQEKKLDYSRGCGFLPEDKRDNAPVLPRVNGKRFSVCPLSTLDGFVLSQASLAHTLFTSGTLPVEGGLGAQTEWFVRAALLFKRKLSEAESAMMNEHKNKSK